MISSTNQKELILWLSILIITIATCFITSYFSFSMPIKLLFIIIWLAFSSAFFFFTVKGKQLTVFIKAAKAELFKVFWPTRQETVQTTSIVMVMVAVTGFILWGIDSGMMWIIAKITHLG
ncbi:MAG: preprotein translocase subunit SecE [Legionellaceae bacterium]|nr:preprotein translocase subunit SecE [Legionellaceae bacterium]|tara:strand:+ start:199 stop:558 length:360 start_codon:yes stop_codon:yes gene_type:complete